MKQEREKGTDGNRGTLASSLTGWQPCLGEKGLRGVKKKRKDTQQKKKRKEIGNKGKENTTLHKVSLSLRHNCRIYMP